MYNGLNDADSKSITWAVFRDKECKAEFSVISTHFWWKFESEKDYAQRLMNVDQLYEICKSITEKRNVPVIIAGDLNCGKNSQQGEAPYEYMKQKGFCDIRLCASQTTDEYTHHDDPVSDQDGCYKDGARPVRVLDHIFTYGSHPIKAEKFDVITTQKALDSSDHCPLIGIFEIL